MLKMSTFAVYSVLFGLKICFLDFTENFSNKMPSLQHFLLEIHANSKHWRNFCRKKNYYFKTNKNFY